MTTHKDKVFLITGASSGIGAGLAIFLAPHGARLALHGRNEEGLKDTIKQCEQLGLPSSYILPLVGDLTEDKVSRTLVEKTVAQFGQLDCLVNNAGIAVPGSVEGGTMEDYDKVMNINCRVPFLLSKLALPHLKKTKGSIVNVSSVNGIRPFSNVAAYCMSKAAVDQLTRCCALDMAEYGIRVNAVNPGVIVTNIHRRMGMDEEKYANFLEHSKTTHALGRVGSVEEVAATISFLASDGASYITGATIPIDGGRHAMFPR